MKEKKYINRIMVMLLSVTMLMAGPGTGLFAFAEDNETGMDNTAVVQSEEQVQTGAGENLEAAAAADSGSADGVQETQGGSDAQGTAGAQDADEGQTVQDAGNDQAAQGGSEAQGTAGAQVADEGQTVQDTDKGQAAQDEDTKTFTSSDTENAAAGKRSLRMTAKGGAAPQSSTEKAVSADDSYFSTLREAVEAATENAVIKVHGNTVEDGKDLVIDKCVTIIAAAASVVIENAKLVVAEGKSLTLGGGSDSKTLTLKNGSIETNGDLTINNGLSIDTQNAPAVHVNSKGRLTSNGGKVATTGTQALKIESGSEGNVIRGGEFSGHDFGLYCYGSIDSISGGKFSGNTCGILVNGGNINTISNGQFTGTGNDSVGMKMLNSGHIGTISGGEFTGNGSSGSGVKMNGTIDSINGGTFKGGSDATWEVANPNGYGILINSSGQVKEINGGTFIGGWGILHGGSGEGRKLTINGGEFYGYGTYGAALQINTQDNFADINGGKFSGTKGITNFGELGCVKNTVIDTTGTSFINYGKCGDIENSKIHSVNWTGITNTNYFVYGTIDAIRNCDISSDKYFAINNNRYSSISEISGGTFKGQYSALYNSGSINIITGGNFFGTEEYGIVNNGYSAKIGKIDIAEGKTSMFVGGYEAIINNTGASLGSVSGYGIYVGGSLGETMYTSETVNIENSADYVNPGYGRYADNKTVLEGNFVIPEGYHMSSSKLLIPVLEMDAVDDTLFHFVTKDNTIIYSGNGSILEKGTAAGGFRDGTLVFRASETGRASVEGNDEDSSFFYTNNGREFLGWNTKADGSGKSYNPGDEIDFSGDEFKDGSDIVLYAQWGEEIIPEAPGEEAPEEPAAEPETPGTPATEPETSAVPAAEAGTPAVQEVPVVQTAVTVRKTGAPAAVTTAAVTGPETESIEDPEVPLAAPETQEAAEEKGWALVNLIAAIMTLIGAAVTCVRRRREEIETMASATMKTGGVVAAAASIVTFLMTENLAGPMSITDNWTVIMLLMLGVQIATSVIAGRLEGEDQEA